MENLQQVLADCRRGNALAWETLVKHFQGRVYSVAYHYCGNQADAEDATQETFIKVYKRLRSFRSKDKAFLPWLLTIARNCCIDRLRRQKTRDKYEDGAAAETSPVAAASMEPEQDAGRRQGQRFLERALAQFDPESRDVLMLKEIQGLKNEEVAHILALPVGTVKSRANRARLKLAKLWRGFNESLDAD